MDDPQSNILQPPAPVPDTSTAAAPSSPPTDDPLELAAVKQWIGRIKAAKQHSSEDYKRMRENMEFAAGFQRRGQAKMDSDEVVINLIIRAVNQKVAQLYCKDPKAVAKRRKRLDYALWDGDVQQLMTALQQLTQALQSGMQAQPDIMALIADFNQGQAWHKLLKRVGDALEIVYQYQCDSQQPNFKYQMKQLVRRVVTCGVGFVRLSCVANDDMPLSSSGTDNTLLGMKKRLQALVDEIDQSDLPEDDPHMEDLRELVDAIQTAEQSGEQQDASMGEKLVFDFPDATAIIVDPNIVSFKEFIGCNWIAQEHIVSVEDTNSYFELRGDDALHAGDGLISYSEDGQAQIGSTATLGTDADGQPPQINVCVWEVFNRVNKTKLFVIDGYKKYAQEPAPVNPCLKRFWPVFALTFNDIEVKRGLKATPYPPSDVQLMKAAQQEWNRTRQEFRNQRAANIPFYLAMEGVMVDSDKSSFADHENSEIIYIKGLPKDGDVNKMVAAFKPAPIDPALYTVEPLKEDMQLAAGFQQADLGTAQAHVTATNSSIAEQSRINGVSSNADDMDDFLTTIAGSAGELIFLLFSKDTVVRIAGQGATVWPDTDKQAFVDQLYLTIVAASSGRPNRAVDIANVERIMPLVLQAMQMPQLWPFVTYMMKVLDDRLDPADFMPAMSALGAGGMQPAGQPMTQGMPQTGQPPAPSGPSTPPMTQPAPSGPQAGAAAHAAFGAQNGGSQPIPVQRN